MLNSSSINEPLREECFKESFTALNIHIIHMAVSTQHTIHRCLHTLSSTITRKKRKEKKSFRLCLVGEEIEEKVYVWKRSLPSSRRLYGTSRSSCEDLLHLRFQLSTSPPRSWIPGPQNLTHWPPSLLSLTRDPPSEWRHSSTFCFVIRNGVGIGKTQSGRVSCWVTKPLGWVQYWPANENCGIFFILFFHEMWTVQ